MQRVYACWNWNVLKQIVANELVIGEQEHTIVEYFVGGWLSLH